MRKQLTCINLIEQKGNYTEMTQPISKLLHMYRKNPENVTLITSIYLYFVVFLIEMLM